MPRAVIAILLLLCCAIAQAREYGHYDIKSLVTVEKSTLGKPSAKIDNVYFDQMLDDLGSHAYQWPVNFDSTDDRHRAEHDVVSFSTALDPLADNFAGSPRMLLRLAMLHAMGHNLDIAGSSDKAVAIFTKLLQVAPNDPRANLEFGAFYAKTTKVAEGIPFLEKAKALGAANADYWLGVSYMTQGEKAKALENLESYAKRVPTDANVERMIDAVRNDKVQNKTIQPNQ